MASERRHRPCIGVTGPDRGGQAAWLFTALAVYLAGGRPRRIRPRHRQRMPGLDGLIIGGGADVDPALYGETRVVPPLRELRRRSGSLSGFLLSLLLFPLIWIARRLSGLRGRHGGDRDRDALETELLQQALAEGKPVLGICRGAQLLNVVNGGTLYQELSDYYDEAPNLDTIWPLKTVDLVSDSRLAMVLGRTRCPVNSLHRQAIRDPGNKLVVVARDRQNVTQAIELEAETWVIGVQWHPEYLPQRREQRRLFRALVTAAGQNRGT
ncbi:gamma-glutamyl-gamma-aminobutyrate hydrolase family protein [Methylonatrum kenyense]|uniref:gamma-glutamyl-gamma-aminobutyrate hydrolase family protein n=1 Tax=Methylonatrum kenyense TaxID=455253 RepID=UPI00200A8027|nr:gamma-glutamyl-gamma-aminobutyrate hydrolase family protein [Methylonatrum kenyense]MCK8516230.1 gamma-glutamyl-gamma-aminobutyrate hydrolase family protein [Methylonatrum kenyense]